MINYAVHGSPVNVYGQRVVPGSSTEMELDRPAWDVDKGVIYAIITGARPSERGGPGGRVDTSQQFLHAGPDANVAKGDQVEVDGKRYDTIGDETSWQVRSHGVVEHLEIPVTAAEINTIAEDVDTHPSSGTQV